MVLVHRHAATADVQTRTWRIVVVPQLVTGERIQSPDIVDRGEINHSIHQQRTGLDFSRELGLKGPRKGQSVYVLGSNLLQLRVALRAIRTVVLRPTVSGRLQEPGVSHSLGPGRRTPGEQESSDQQLESHGNLSGQRYFEGDADVRHIG